MMKVLVTGGSGFIGTNVIEDLIKKGFEVINIDIAEPKKQSHRDIWKKVDIRDYDALVKIFIDFAPEYVLHLAARTDLDGEKLEDYDSNILGVKYILDCCEKITSIKKIVITSSMLICKVGYQPRDQFDYAPSTLYGESKVETERQVWERDLNIDWAIIRPTSIWGPWFGVPYRDFFDLVMKKRYIHLGNKECTKTYGFIGNSVYQIEEILFNDNMDKEYKVFYIGDYSPYPIGKWADEIAEELDYRILKIPYIFFIFAAVFGDILKKFGISFPMTSFRLKNMTTDNIVDMSKTKKVAENLPYSRKEGIKITLQWMKTNKTENIVI